MQHHNNLNLRIKQEKKEPKLYLRFDFTNEDLKDEVFNVLDNYIGTTKIWVRDISSGSLYELPKSVNVTKALLYELYNSLGENNTVYK